MTVNVHIKALRVDAWYTVLWVTHLGNDPPV